ncbi:hypothetical protein D3C85_917920 [compost metagenome]
MRWRPRPRSIRIRTLSPASVRSCGVRLARTSATGANAVMTSDTGATTWRCSPSCSQDVFMDRESLPTGMDRPVAWHSSLTADTVSYSAASCPATPQAAIQLADSLMSSRRATSAAARLVRASATAMRPDAGASSMAMGVRSPIDMASPRKPS